MGASWACLGRVLARLGRVMGQLGWLLDRLGAILGRPGSLLNASWARLGPSWERLKGNIEKNYFGRGFGEVFVISRVFAKDLRLHKLSHRFFDVFCILCELLANARTLNFIAPVDVFRCFLRVDVFR